ncbi:tripartite tricarboxylate transporter substrate binding protein [Variovorax sp.]|uniref:tripartite tricarboxylate transporter substrate binding protein n=1 Tax=Variovorax sp. TaxID=1871043 RepID=UPI002D54F322|nr:tripartite tricarboxylate transporter substrate binding protein [Variovorax sp.]HYP84447.1 tripartite tricarboxylate transporter substrate binding protein [Variovorax sp.]
MKYRTPRGLGTMLLAMGLACGAHAAYPDKPIRFIVPYPPGGGTDVVARAIGQKLEQMWGAQVIVENKPGGDTQVGTSAVARAPADGYTFGFITPTFAINKSLYPRLPFDPVHDFAPVAALARSPFFLVVGNGTKAGTLKELIALSKAQNGNMSYSASSSITFVTGEMFRNAAGIEALHVPYKGSAPSVTAVAGGEVAFTLDTLMATKPLVDGGLLKVLAVSSRTRFKELPHVPTLSEAGLKDFEMSFWYGMIAPAGTPADVVEKTNAAVTRILQMPDVRAKLQSLGTEPLQTTPAQFTAMVKEDFVRYEAVVKANNLQPGS